VHPSPELLHVTYISLTIPSLIVATYGGGTDFATQRECLEMMNCYGKGKVNKFAEIVASVALAARPAETAVPHHGPRPRRHRRAHLFAGLISSPGSSLRRAHLFAGLISSPGSSLRRAHLFAGLIGPARRAARIAPAEALRST